MSWSLFSERVLDLSSHSTPEELGPGYYDIPDKIGNDKQMAAPFGSGGETYVSDQGVKPAPGQYEAKPIDPPVSKTSMFKSKTKRKLYNHTMNNPGPAQYQHMHDWTPECQRVAYKKPRPNSFPVTPYVGQDINGFEVDKNGKLFAVKKKFHDQTYLGPGSYELAPLNKVTPISMNKSSNREIYSHFTNYPGPGAYTHTEYITKMLHQIRDTRYERPPEKSYPKFLTHEPWVTSTSPETLSGLKSKSVRTLFPRVEQTPSPDTYIISRPILKTTKFVNAAAFGFNTARKDYWSGNDTPGPGSYEVRKFSWVKKGPKLGRKAVDRDRVSTVPGPGSYNFYQKVDKRPNSVFITKTKREIQNGSDAPGPGFYNPDVLRASGITIKMNQTDRFKKIGEWQNPINSPSPDTYNITSDYSKGKTIPKIGHRPLYSRNNNPGPGAYEVTHGTLLQHSFNSSVPI